jgi:nucleoside-diphosphate-sugar epimerase
MKKVLLTGGAGRISSYLLPDFVKKYSVTVFDQKRPDFDGKYTFFEGDLTNPEDLMKATKGIDGIVHTGAVSIYQEGIDSPIIQANVLGTYHVLDAARANGVGAVVNSSSVCVWGVINWKKRFTPEYFPVDEEIPHWPDDSYGVSKVFGERLCYADWIRYGIRSISFRLATVAFPFEQYWIGAWENIDNPEYSFPEFPMDMIDFMWQYVDPRDLPQAYILALEALFAEKIDYGVYNLGADDVFSTVPSIELIRRYYPDTKYIKNENGFLKRENAPLWDISKIKKELGFQPKYTWRDYQPAADTSKQYELK